MRPDIWLTRQGNTKGGSIIVPFTSCLTGLESAVTLLTFFVFICKTDKSKLVEQEFNGTVILPPLVFPDPTYLWPESPYFKNFKIGQALFVAWTLLELFMKLELCWILFHGKFCYLVGVLNKDHSVWLIGTSLPTPVSCPPLGGSHSCTARHICSSKSLKLRVNVQAIKPHFETLELMVTPMLGCTSVWMYPNTK